MKAERCINGGFTLVEVLLVIVAVSSLGTIGYVATTGVRESSRERKLEADAASVNSAVQLYQVNGGVIASGATADEVLSKLKTRADATSTAETIGLTGSFLDVRTEPVWQTAGEAATSQLRAVWDSSSGTFVTRRSGAAGIKEFQLDDSKAADAIVTESRVPTLKGATETQWVWDFTDQAADVTRLGSSPTTVAGLAASGGIAAYTQPLSPPVFSDTGGPAALSAYDKSVSISNSNPAGSSQVYVSSGGAFQLYSGAITVAPGTTLTAIAITLVPSTYSNSPAATASYTATPVQLAISVSSPSSMTYAQAGGAMKDTSAVTPAPATILLTSTGIPAAYMSSSYFQILYTTDGSNPLTSGTAQQGPAFSSSFASPNIPVDLSAWGSSQTLRIRAAAKALNTSLFTTSSIATVTITATVTNLSPPSISPASQDVTDNITVTISDAGGYPVGSRIQYTTNGTDPGVIGFGDPSTGMLYTAPFTTSVGNITARAYGPTGYSQWFQPSSTIAVAYTPPAFSDGAIVGNATLNGTFVGSLIYARPTGSMNDITFNSNAKITKGNLYLPGTPTIKKSNGTVWSLATDSQFAVHIEGRQFLADGTEIIPATEPASPRVKDEGDLLVPSNYTVTFNSSSLVEGKVIRQYDSPYLPSVPTAPASTTGGGSQSFNSPPSGPISASTYSTITLNSSSVGNVTLLGNSTSRTSAADGGGFKDLTANNGTSFILGDAANPNVTQYYSIDTLTLNSSSDLQIVGKVVITVKNQININNGSTIGNSLHPEWLQLLFPTSAGNFTANSGSSAYAQLVVPQGSVTFNSGSTFSGSVTSKTLTINSNSVIFTLPPVIP